MIQNPFCSHNAVVRWEFIQRTEEATTKKDSRKLYLFVMVYLWCRVGKHNSFGCDDSPRILQFKYSTNTHIHTCTHTNFTFCVPFSLDEVRTYLVLHTHIHIDNESVNLKNIIYGQFRTINACDVHWHAYTHFHASNKLLFLYTYTLIYL